MAKQMNYRLQWTTNAVSTSIQRSPCCPRRQLRSSGTRKYPDYLQLLGFLRNATLTTGP
jgi:hypothetical protein